MSVVEWNTARVEVTANATRPARTSGTPVPLTPAAACARRVLEFERTNGHAWITHHGQSQPPSTRDGDACHKVILDGEDDRLGHLVGLSGPWDGVSSRRARESCGALPIFGAEHGSRNYSRRVTLMRRGASSRATDRAICSTAAPTEATATCPGFGLRAGVPLTSTIAPVGVRCGAARRWHIPRACRSCRGSHQGPS